MTLYGYFRTDRKTLVFQGFVRCNQGVTERKNKKAKLHPGYTLQTLEKQGFSYRLF